MRRSQRMHRKRRMRWPGRLQRHVCRDMPGRGNLPEELVQPDKRHLPQRTHVRPDTVSRWRMRRWRMLRRRAPREQRQQQRKHVRHGRHERHGRHGRHERHGRGWFRWQWLGAAGHTGEQWTASVTRQRLFVQYHDKRGGLFRRGRCGLVDVGDATQKAFCADLPSSIDRVKPGVWPGQDATKHPKFVI